MKINADSRTLDFIKNFNRSQVIEMWDDLDAGKKLVDGQKGKGKDNPTLPKTTNEFKKVDFEDIKLLTSQKSEDYEKILLYIHGGAYIYGIDPNQIDYVDKLVTQTNIKAYAPLYNVAPDYTYKSTLDTIYKLYKELQKENKEIIIGGDSAGAGFSIAFCHYLKDKGDKLPDKMILISPWVDVTTSNPKIESYKDIEIMLPRTALYASGKAWAGDKEWTDKLISPINGDFSKMPKTLMFGSTDEIFYPDIIKTYEKFNDAGSDIKFVTIEHGFHVIPIVKDMKEASEALQIAKDFINN